MFTLRIARLGRAWAGLLVRNPRTASRTHADTVGIDIDPSIAVDIDVDLGVDTEASI